MSDLRQIIEREYRTCGFSAVGTVAFALLDQERDRFGEWLAQGYGADMGYLERSAEYRHDLRRLFPDTQSVVVTLTSYHRPAEEVAQPDGVPRIARFAWSDDYHEIIKANLNRLLNAVRTYPEFENVKGRAVVDSAPTFERAWAVRAGLGWIGRSSMLINPHLGSFTLVGLLLLDAPLAADFIEPAKIPNGCGECQKCVDACPTGAIVAPKTVDARRCISYQTIERKEQSIEDPFREALDGRIFGCDRCMEVCPYNNLKKMPSALKNTGLDVVPGRLGIDTDQWRTMTDEEFNTLFRKSPLQRSGLSKIKSSLR